MRTASFRRRTPTVALITALALVIPMAALAAGVGPDGDGPDSDPPGLARQNGDPSGKALGMVKPVAEKAQGAEHANPNGAGNGQGNDGGLVGGARPGPVKASPNLTYHGGPVMRTGNTTYAIYWNPAGYVLNPPPSYANLINRFLSDVAVDATANRQTNTYFSDTQYSDTSGATISIASAFGGAIVDTNAFPASGCTDTIADTSVCVSDAQLAAEVARVAAANGIAPGPTKLFFIFTPQGVGSCSGTSCAYSHFCAYHSWSGSGSSVLLYANQPYAAHAGCDSGVRPNGDDADPTINVTSHEHNETITDPQGSAWFDRQGYENADKCAWTFGTPLGGSGSTAYNQLINDHRYYVQQNWSNQSSRCVLVGV